MTGEVIVATTVVQISLLRRFGSAGAPGSLPGTTSPLSSCERMPHGSTANSTVHHTMKYTASEVVSDIRLRLLDLDQRPAKILGVQEQHRLAVGADLRLPVAQDPRAGRLEPLPRGPDVVHLVAQMMHAAVGIAVQEVFDWRSGSQRLAHTHLG